MLIGRVNDRPPRRGARGPRGGQVARRIEIGKARELCAGLLTAAGMPENAAWATARALTVAEAWGRASHGLLRLPHYLERLAAGGSAADAELTLVAARGATAAYDGGNGLGHWQLARAGAHAVALAQEYGIGAVSVANSGHAGVLGLGVVAMVEAGFVGIAFSTGPAAMPAIGGDRALLSTSPIAAGIPTRPRPAIVDLATSAVARGTIAATAAAGGALERGWAFDARGVPTTDPAVALAGMLAPLGGAKGFALAFLVESLTGGMVGPHLAPSIADPLSSAAAALPQRVAHLVLALDPAALDGDGRSSERLAALARSIEESGGRVPGAGHLLPSEIPEDTVLVLPDTLAATLATRAAASGVAVPASLAGG